MNGDADTNDTCSIPFAESATGRFVAEAITKEYRDRCARDFNFCVCENGRVCAKFRLRGHKRPITDLVFSPNEKWLATIAKDSTLRLWNTEKRKCIAVWQTDDSHFDFLCVTFSPDSLFVASFHYSSSQGIFFIWDVESRERIAVVELDDFPNYFNGMHLHLSDNNSTLRLHYTDIHQRVAQIASISLWNAVQKNLQRIGFVLLQSKRMSLYNILRVFDNATTLVQNAERFHAQKVAWLVKLQKQLIEHRQ